jgi:chorismate-pyruvate lyase
VPHPLDTSKELRLLLAYFGEARPVRCEEVPGPHVPEPYRRLLVHDEHMTVTLERYYDSPVRVVPYRVHRHGDLYGRMLDLLDKNDRVVMTGLMLFNFNFCNAEVRDEIIAAQGPLGRILIEHDILRHVSPTAFVRIAGDDPLARRFHAPEPKPVYGRLATLFCDNQPAVDLLEVVAP